MYPASAVFLWVLAPGQRDWTVWNPEVKGRGLGLDMALRLHYNFSDRFIRWKYKQL